MDTWDQRQGRQAQGPAICRQTLLSRLKSVGPPETWHLYTADEEPVPVKDTAEVWEGGRHSGEESSWPPMAGPPKPPRTWDRPGSVQGWAAPVSLPPPSPPSFSSLPSCSRKCSRELWLRSKTPFEEGARVRGAQDPPLCALGSGAHWLIEKGCPGRGPALGPSGSSSHRTLGHLAGVRRRTVGGKETGRACGQGPGTQSTGPGQ